MARSRGRVLGIVLFGAVVTAGGVPASGDGGNRATSTDAVAKERADEFEELGKKPSIQNTKRRMEILRSLFTAPCVTARRFLLGVLKKPSAPGDERLYALDTLVQIADEQTFEAFLAVLVREKDPTLWQAFGDALGERPVDVVREWAVGPGLSAREPEAVCACLEGLARRPQTGTAERIAAVYAKHAASPAGGDVAYHALKALVPADAAAARKALLQACKHADVRVRLAAADLLPSSEPFDAEAEAAVRGLLQDEAAPVRQTTAVRTGAAKRVALANALIGLLADPRLRTRHVASVALEQISGRHLGHDPAAWAAWLDKKDPGKPADITLPTYHGFSVASDRVVFLVDGSDSMAWPWRKPVHRIDVARSELASVLRQLTPDTLFNVLVYSDKVFPWKKAEVPASPENVAAAVKWAEKALAEPKGDTHLYEALEAAYANNPQFDTIFLLTDGNPTNGKYWTTEGLLASVRVWARHRRTAVQTIGLSLADEDRGMPNLTEDLSVMATLLRALAQATSGEFREILRIPAPAKAPDPK